MRVRAAVVALALAALCPACARSGRKPVFPVQGQVLVKGRPAARAQVTFHPVEGSGPDTVRPVGHVDERGRFRLTTYAEGDGAPEGEYRVTVQWFLATRTRGGADDYQSVNYLPARYGRAETSGLRATVTRGDNNLPTIELKPN
jgi:hypothetical protein